MFGGTGDERVSSFWRVDDVRGIEVSIYTATGKADASSTHCDLSCPKRQ
ncbi:hypothetical protein RSSM_06603 [Rhodopirellula sallentina SM41]|uniref:Uncharacterized protein n=1 Tax=Rhodopirellula sallentina SM41 TaxID=1263870 RepID=M5TS35_9BACT|nr:hypothetical protein RSSM_06603 [Rhodopirellula sallentina SM41]